MKKIQTKKLVIAAMCVALGVVLPFAFHSIPNSGSIFLPMHLTVLLCGMICGWPMGLICGILTPLLSSVLTSMPPMAYLPSMLCELAAYGFIAGLLSQFMITKNRIANLYISLVASMLIGRAVYGILNALIFSAGRFSFPAFLSGAFVTALPGIVIQLILLPAIIIVLEKAHVIEFERNIKQAQHV